VKRRTKEEDISKKYELLLGRQQKSRGEKNTFWGQWAQGNCTLNLLWVEPPKSYSTSNNMVLDLLGSGRRRKKGPGRN